MMYGREGFTSDVREGMGSQLMYGVRGVTIDVREERGDY